MALYVYHMLRVRQAPEFRVRGVGAIDGKPCSSAVKVSWGALPAIRCSKTLITGSILPLRFLHDGYRIFIAD